MNPLKIFEYHSAGLACYCAMYIPSLGLILLGDDLLITGPTRNDLTESLKKIIQDKELRFRLSYNKGLIDSIENEYTWEKYTGKIVENIAAKLLDKS